MSTGPKTAKNAGDIIQNNTEQIKENTVKITEHRDEFKKRREYIKVIEKKIEDNKAFNETNEEHARLNSEDIVQIKAAIEALTTRFEAANTLLNLNKGSNLKY